MLPVSGLTTDLWLWSCRNYLGSKCRQFSCANIFSHTPQFRTTKAAGRIAFNTDCKEYKWEIVNSFVYCKEMYQMPETRGGKWAEAWNEAWGSGQLALVEQQEQYPGRSSAATAAVTGFQLLQKLCITVTSTKIKGNWNSNTQQGKTDVINKMNNWM